MKAASEKKQPKFIDKSNDNHQKKTYPPPRHRVHLKSAADVRRLLSSVVNDLRQQKIDPQVSGKITYACQVLLTVFEQINFAAQIKELEDRAFRQEE